jgi:hypothetical protein
MSPGLILPEHGKPKKSSIYSVSATILCTSSGSIKFASLLAVGSVAISKAVLTLLLMTGFALSTSGWHPKRCTGSVAVM